MKKNFRRAMAAVMAAALTLSLAGTAAEADAAKKKKIKLASKSVTVNVKKTKTVKIKNVKASKVKKLTVKSASKKIATAKAKGKTAVKVTGKKAGKSTKVKITLKIKGQKKATKLTLKVKVAKAKPPVPATNAPAPATQAPNVPSTKAPDAPAVSQPPQGGDASQAPATQKPSDKPKESKTPKPAWTPDPDKQNKVEDFTLTYGENGEGYKFEAAKMVNFSDAANYASAAPKDGIDVRYYDQVVVNYKSDEEITSGDEGWGGKATLSSTDEGLGCTAYTDGLYRRYLNDLTYADGGYKVEYRMSDVGEAGGLLDGYDFEDVGLVDCVSVQLESNTHPYVDSEDGSQKGVNFRLMSIEFKAPEKAPGESAQPGTSAKPGESAQPGASAKPGESAQPGASAKPGESANPAEPVTDADVEMTFKKGESAVTEIGVGETAAVEVALKDGVNAEIEGTPTITVTDPTIAEVQNGTIKGLKKGEAVVNAVVKIKGQTDTVTATGTLIITGENDLKVEAAIQAPEQVALGETAALEVVLTKVVDVDTSDVQITGVTWTVVEGEADVETDGAETAVLTGKAYGTVKVKATVDVSSKSNAKDPGKAVTEVVEIKVYIPDNTLTLDKTEYATGLTGYTVLGFAKLDKSKLEAGQKINVGQTGTGDTKLRYVLKTDPKTECGKADWQTGGKVLVTSYNADPIELTADHISSMQNATDVILEIQANADLFNSECTPAITVTKDNNEVSGAVSESSSKYEFPGLGNWKPIAQIAFNLSADELSNYEKVIVKFKSSAFSGKLQTELVRNTENIYEDKNSVAQQYDMVASDDMTAELPLSALTNATNKSGILIQTGNNGTTTFKGKITISEIKLVGKK